MYLLKNYIIIVMMVFYLVKSIILQEKIILSKALAVSYSFFVFWIAYSLATTLWAMNTKFALLGTIYISCYFCMFFLITQWLVQDKKNFARFQNFLVFIYYFLLGLAMWEMISMQHLRTSSFYEQITPIPTGAFFNRNDLAAIFLFMLPFSLFYIKIVKNKLYHVFAYFCTLLVMIIFIVQGARIALLIAPLFILYYIIRYEKLKTILIFCLAVTILISALASIFPLQANIYLTLMNAQFSSINSEVESVRLGSLKIRELLIEQSIDLAYESGFWGIGQQNFTFHMFRWRTAITGGVAIPHNFLLEYLVTNGLLIFLGLFSMLVYIIYRAFKLCQLHKKDAWKYYIAAFSMLLFFFSSILPSSISNEYYYWCVIAYVFALVSSKNGVEKLE